MIRLTFILISCGAAIAGHAQKDQLTGTWVHHRSEVDGTSVKLDSSYTSHTLTFRDGKFEYQIAGNLSSQVVGEYKLRRQKLIITNRKIIVPANGVPYPDSVYRFKIKDGLLWIAIPAEIMIVDERETEEHICWMIYFRLK